ncbi:PH domain-containing protein [Coralloluteibacterium thermophilus]|uniref:PH domain-containing protein n=1 Tax=Coralloluteibacterium thermophilum TaxID=2707049 RepID=A0ABV9NDX7_9GAMM
MTTTPSERDPAAAPAAAGPERRLHPLSFLFVLAAQLRQMLIPLAVLIFVGSRGREDGWELTGAAAVAAVLVAIALVRYATFRFAIGNDGLVIRSGLLQRTARHIPFARIHDVNLHQTLLHRLLGVADVRLESAGSSRPEAEMRVLALADAQALEDLVRQRGRDAGRTGTEDADAPAAAPSAPGRTLLALDGGELLRLGLISNRGMVVVAAAFGLLAQSGSRLFFDALEDWSQRVFGYAQALHLGTAALVAAGLSLLVLALLALRALSVVLATLTYHGFRLAERDERLQVERGLFTRMRASAPRHRIQAFSIEESLLQRWFGRRALRVDTAVAGADSDQRGLRELAPIATPEQVDGLIRHLLPGTAWPALDWHGLHPRAWRRLLVVPATLVLVATLAGLWRFGLPALWTLALLPLVVVRARLWARHAQYAAGERLVAVREGWLRRRWRLAEIAKLQGIRLTQSPFDRRHGMATLWLDTAGAGLADLPLRIRFLPEDTARALHERLGAEIARRRLRW